MRCVVFVILAFVVASCTSRVQVTTIVAGSDYRGLSDSERRSFAWAAIDVTVPAEAARSFRRAESTVWLEIFRCDTEADKYPAFATLRGKLFRYNDIPESLEQPLTFTFYLPQAVQQRENYDCAAIDARGYVPHYFHSQTMALPALHFVAFPARGEARSSAPIETPRRG